MADDLDFFCELMRIKYWYSGATLIQCSLLIIPLSLGLMKIFNVADRDVIDAILRFNEHPFTQDALLSSAYRVECRNDSTGDQDEQTTANICGDLA